MTLSNEPRKVSNHCEQHEQDIKAEGVSDEDNLPTIKGDMLHDRRTKDSSLHEIDLEQSQFLIYKGQSRTGSPMVDQNILPKRETLRLQDFSSNRNNETLSFNDGNNAALEAVAFLTDGENEPKQKLDFRCKLEETNTKSVHSWLLLEEEKIRERSRKGRERSLRTRRRNTARLKLLEENCAHFSKENKVLRELARSLGEQNTERVIELLKQYSLLKEEKPEPHKLSRSESYYLNLLSPLSVTASTTPRGRDSQVLKALEGALETEHSLIPSTYKGLPSRESSDAPKCTHTLPDINKRHAHTSVQEVSHVSVANENNSSSTGVFYSVFADPVNCDEKEVGFSIEDIYEQPPLSAEDICRLLEEVRSVEELLCL